MSLCGYKNILGRPGEGAHFHVGGVAVVDVALTVGAAAVASSILGYQFWAVLVFLFILSVTLHWIFCVPTAVTVGLGLI